MPAFDETIHGCDERQCVVQLGSKYVIEPVDLEVDVLLQHILQQSKLAVLWKHVDEDGNGALLRRTIRMV
jgi:hypothetical protein